MPTPHVPARIAAASLVAARLLAASALAEDCRTDGGPLTDLAKATVNARKAHFIAGTCADDPSTQVCKVKAHLVAGDTVFLGPAAGKLQCVGYLGAGGGYTEGWVAAADLGPY